MNRRRNICNLYSTKIILRPSKIILDTYLKKDTKSHIFTYDSLDKFEISAMFTLLGLFRPKSIIRLPVVSRPSYIAMPDFLFDSTPIEIKTPQSKRGIEGRIRASKEQLSRGGILVLNLDNYKESLIDISKIIEHYLAMHKIMACLALRDNHLFCSFPTKSGRPSPIQAAVSH